MFSLGTVWYYSAILNSVKGVNKMIELGGTYTKITNTKGSNKQFN